jgi:ubiquinone/menaquinone biosynthesis C-methylase UbiE
MFPRGDEDIRAAAVAADRFLARLSEPKPGETVLEIGCGFGLIARIFAEEHGCSVTAVDSEEGRLQRARTLGKGIPGLSFRRADAHHLPFADATFDIVIAQEALGFTGDPDASLVEVARVVKPDGRIVVSDFWAAADVEEEIGVLFGRCRFPTRGQWRRTFKTTGRSIRRWDDLGIEIQVFYETLAHAFLTCDGARWPLRKAASNTMLNRAALIAEGSLGKFAALA